MQTGQLLVTRDDPANAARIYYGYDQPDGLAVSNVGRRITVGQYASEKKAGGLFGFGTALWYQVKLNQPIINKGVNYAFVWMKADELTVSLETPVSVWATSKGAVAYLRPATTSTVLQRKTVGQLIGTSEGTHNGGFIYVKLATPSGTNTYGYVLATQLSTQDPTVITDTEGVGLYGDPSNWLTNTIGAKPATIVRTVVIVILVALAGGIVWHLMKHRNDS